MAWKLKEFKVSFERGFNHLSTVDRYEGKVKYFNAEGEEFVVNVDQQCSEAIMALIAQKLLETSTAFVADLQASVRASLNPVAAVSVAVPEG
jgi:hypothetical protein